LVIPAKPLPQKLGIKPGFCIFVYGAPSAYGDLVGLLPNDVTIATTRNGVIPQRKIRSAEFKP